MKITDLRKFLTASEYTIIAYIIGFFGFHFQIKALTIVSLLICCWTIYCAIYDLKDSQTPKMKRSCMFSLFFAVLMFFYDIFVLIHLIK